MKALITIAFLLTSMVGMAQDSKSVEQLQDGDVLIFTRKAIYETPGEDVSVVIPKGEYRVCCVEVYDGKAYSVKIKSLKENIDMTIKLWAVYPRGKMYVK